jgi:VanZ family protein
MAAENHLRIARWLTLVVGLLIIYGSLYPFSFVAPPKGSLVALLTRLDWARTTRADVLANLLLYLPLGALLSFALPTRWSAARAAFVAAGIGTLLAASLETLQLLAPFRVASLTDLVLNGIGTFAGAVLSLGVRAAGERMGPMLGAIDLRAAPVALVLVSCWLFTRMAPFEWNVTWGAWRRSLRPLWEHPSLPLGALLGHLAAWGVILVALRATVRRDAGFVVLAMLVLVVATARIVGAGHTLVWAELVPMVLVLLTWPLAETWPDRRLAATALVVLAAAVLVAGLAPAGSFGGLANAAHEFALAPLDVKALGTPALLAQRCFTAGALVWLVYRLGVGALRAGLLAGALLLAVEAVQLWMPGHESTLTAPSLALCAAGLIALFEPEAS